ncbi:MAG: hypothetical protein ACLFR0_01060 [Alphaproteobacteria bacterium]
MSKDDSKLVLLKRTEMQGEALITKSFLESHGIDVYLMDHTDVLNYVGFSGTRLMVSAQNLNKALDLLNNTDLTVDNKE